MSPHTAEEAFAFTGEKIRCVLAHDHVLLRQGLRRLLEDEPDIDVVSEAGNAAECLRKVYEFRPDIVVADSATLGLSAAEAELCVARECSATRVIFLSVESGAGSDPTTNGCDVRRTSVEQLVEIVRNLFCSGQKKAQETSSSYGSSQRASQSDETLSPAEHPLTAREREVLKLLAEGKTVRTAATALGVSNKTVDSHKFNLMRKLGIHNKAELVMWAIQRKVVKIPVNF